MRTSVVCPVRSNDCDILNSIAGMISQQNTPPSEVIFVDDASQKKLNASQLGNFSFNVKVIRNETSMGAGRARQQAMDVATGDIIFFLDSDDVWKPCHIATLVEEHKKYGDRDMRLICSTALVRSGSRELKKRTLHGVLEYRVSDWLFVKNGFLQTSGLSISKGVISKVRWASLPRHQDYQFLFDCEKNNVLIAGCLSATYTYVVSQKRSDAAFSKLFLDRFEGSFSVQSLAAFRQNFILRGFIKERQFCNAWKHCEGLPDYFFLIKSYVKLKIKGLM